MTGDVAAGPVVQIAILLALVALVGYKPGFFGYRWHAQALEKDEFEHLCTVAATNRRQAIKAAANDAYFNGPIRVAAA